MDVPGYHFPLPAVWTCTGYLFAMQYEHIFYIIILCYHLCHVIILCYHLFDVIFYAIIWIYHLVLSFFSCLSQLTKIFGTFTKILSRWVWVLGKRIWDLRSGIQKNLGSMIKPQPPFCKKKQLFDAMKTTQNCCNINKPSKNEAHVQLTSHFLNIYVCLLMVGFRKMRWGVWGCVCDMVCVYVCGWEIYPGDHNFLNFRIC